MNRLNKIYQYVNILSLDVVAGSVICSLFFARLFSAAVSFYTLSALGLTVWIVYTLDHLRDALIIPVTSTDRHRFHEKYFKWIFITALVMIVLDFVVIWFVPLKVLMYGSVLWMIVLLYLILQRYLKFLKELFVACLYTAGVLLPSMASMNATLVPLDFLLIGKFFLTALMNLLLFSLFDYSQDRKQQQHSFVTWFGPSSTRRSILVFGLFNILSGIRLWSFDRNVALIFIAMNATLLTILFMRKRLVSNNLYRILGDSVFFIPLLYLI